MDLTNINKDRKMRRTKTPLDLTTMVYGKIPPQAVDLENAILGALMVDVNCVFIGMSRLFPEIFYKDANQRIFTAIQKLYDQNNKIDILTVIDQLKKWRNWIW